MVDRLIVIGASSGGVDALTALTAGLPADLPAAVLIVLHIGAHRSLLPRLLSKRCPLPVAAAEHGEPLRPGQVRTAPGDFHLLVDDGVLRLERGPKEHHTRPAIDPLFRTAAVSHGSAVTGVILTGELDDGKAGLQAIKAAGGVCVVQDPATAVAPSMPNSALRHAQIDHCVPIDAMPELFTKIHASAPGGAARPVPDRLRHENDLMLRRGEPMEHLSALGTPSPFTCPDCHGGLWRLNDVTPERYRCHTGHAYTARTLQDAMATAGDESAWSALRAMQERHALLQHMSLHEPAAAEADRMRRAAAELNRQAAAMRAMLGQSPDPIE